MFIACNARTSYPNFTVHFKLYFFSTGLDKRQRLRQIVIIRIHNLHCPNYHQLTTFVMNFRVNFSYIQKCCKNFEALDISKKMHITKDLTHKH